jgi:hypothetical protein
MLASQQDYLFRSYGKVHGLDFKGSIRELTERAGLTPGKSKSSTYQKQTVTGVYCFPSAENMQYWKERIEPGWSGRGKDLMFFHSDTVKPGNGYQVYMSLLEEQRDTMKGRNAKARLYNESCLAGADTVFIPEGETKVDLLNSMGLAAVALDTGSTSTLQVEEAALRATGMTFINARFWIDRH